MSIDHGEEAAEEEATRRQHTSNGRCGDEGERTLLKRREVVLSVLATHVLLGEGNDINAHDITTDNIIW